MRGVFVTGTDTEAGKTLVCATLLAGAPEHWRYWKPVQTGLATDHGDTATVLKRAQLPEPRALAVGVRLPLPASPHFAAQQAGEYIEVAALRRHADEAFAPADFAIVEGAGGLLAPLNGTETILDLARALALPVLIVVRVKLGAINHALLTEQALRAAGVPALGFVLSGDADLSLTTALAAHAHLPVIGHLPTLPLDAPLADHGARLREAVLRQLPELPLDTRLIERDRAVVWHPFTQAQTAAAPLPVVAAQGSWLQLVDGARVFDAISSWWTCLIGHSHPRLVAAIASQAAQLDHVLFAGCTHPGAVELAEKLVARAPAGLTRVFYSDDGSTAVEVALKMAVQFHAQSGQPQRTRFLALEGGYHGDTFGAMSVGDPSDFAGTFAPLLWPVTRLPVPTVDGDPLAADVDLAPTLAALERILLTEGATLAAVIVEPMVQGAGGMRFHPPQLLAHLALRVRAHGGLVIADEVMTGFGRTGTLFACEHAQLSPDLLCVAKGLTGGTLPLAATLATEAIFAAFLGPDARRALLHGHSFTANPIACAAALASMHIAQDEGLLAKARALHQLYGDILPPLRALPGVRAVRWLGGIGVLELQGGGYHDVARSKAIAAFCLARGVLVRPLGPVIYTLPPLASDPADLAAAWRTIAAAVTACAGYATIVAPDSGEPT